MNGRTLQFERIPFRLPTPRQLAVRWATGCVLLGSVFLPGCGGHGAPPAETSARGTSAPADTHPEQRPTLQVPDAGLATLEKRPALVSPPADSPELRRAQALVQTLVTPGTSMEAWEQTHEELVSLGAAAVPVLAEKLKDGNDMEREMAATTLAFLGPQSAGASDSLIAALQDKSQFVRANASAALVQIPEHSGLAVPVLVGLLASKDSHLRQLAATNLNAVGVEAAPHVTELARALDQPDPPDVLVPVVELLGRIGPQAQPAIPGLQKIVFEQPGELGDAASAAIRQITQQTSTP